jgi:hypothetical protein
MDPDKLVIFDYSGTLSIEAPGFARPDRLVCALEESGLAALGVADPAFFWEQIVGPTWVEGSTTRAGYKRVMAERIMALGPAPSQSGPGTAAAASRFVDAYLGHSRVDPAWRPILSRLARRPDTALVVATDHYAEITEVILGHLKGWNIPARRAEDWSSGEKPAPVAVASSADIGFWKADRRFWALLKARLPLAAVRSVLIVDDFGFNEEQGDRYGELPGVEARQAQTLSLLKELFGARVQAIPFFLKGPARQQAAAFIAEAGERIRQWTMDGDQGTSDRRA